MRREAKMKMALLVFWQCISLPWNTVGLRSAVGSASDSRAMGRSPGFDTRSGHILSFPLPLNQEEQLSVTGKSMCMNYWLTGWRSNPAQEKGGYVKVEKDKT